MNFPVRPSRVFTRPKGLDFTLRLLLKSNWMKKVNLSTKNIGRFAGKWVVIDPKKEKIIAVGNTLEEISALVTHTLGEKAPPAGEAPYSFLVPRKDEGPYVLWIKLP